MLTWPADPSTGGSGSCQLDSAHGYSLPARTRIHRCDQHKIRGEGERHLRACDGDAPLLDRLAEHFEGAALEFRELIEEQHAMVRQAHFARPRRADTAAQQSGVGDAVMRGAERALGQ
jgi:hypothetical protein